MGRPDDVIPGERERDVALYQIVADRNLPAESIATQRGDQLVELVRVALNQNWDTEVRETDRVGHALLVAEVGEHDENTRDLVTIIPKEGRAFLCLRERLDASEFRRGLLEHHDPQAHLFEQSRDLLPCFGYQVVGEDIPVPHDHAKRCLAHPIPSVSVRSLLDTFVCFRYCILTKVQLSCNKNIRQFWPGLRDAPLRSGT